MFIEKDGDKPTFSEVTILNECDLSRGLASLILKLRGCASVAFQSLVPKPNGQREKAKAQGEAVENPTALHLVDQHPGRKIGNDQHGDEGQEQAAQKPGIDVAGIAGKLAELPVKLQKVAGPPDPECPNR